MAIKILLALDESAASRGALDQMVARPWPAGSAFEVVSVVEPSHLGTTRDEVHAAARGVDGMVQSAVARLSAAGQSASGIVLFGDPKRVIPERAKTIDADFIVAGSSGSLGSVPAGVLRRAPCSMEIVRTKSGGGPPTKLLLATDGSEFSEDAAQSIAGRPWPAGTEVRVFSAVELILPTGYAMFEPPYIDTAALETARAESMKRSQDAIGRAREILSAAGLSTSESISVLLDPPRTTILNEAADFDADMIVLGSHGHHGLDRLLLGSVSESVATHAACSVEVIRG